MAIPGGDLVAVDDCQRPAGKLHVLVLAQVIQEMPWLRRPLTGVVVISADGDDPSSPGAQALQHIGVSDVPAVDREVAVRHQGLHARVQVAVGVRQNGHTNHGTDATVYEPGAAVPRTSIAFIALPPSVAGLCFEVSETTMMRLPLDV